MKITAKTLVENINNFRFLNTVAYPADTALAFSRFLDLAELELQRVGKVEDKFFDTSGAIKNADGTYSTLGLKPKDLNSLNKNLTELFNSEIELPDFSLPFEFLKNAILPPSVLKSLEGWFIVINE